MKKIALAALLIGVLAGTSFAQEKGKSEKKEMKIDKSDSKTKQEKGGEKAKKPKSAEQRAEGITNRMMKITGAAAEKKPKVYDVNLATEKQRDADRAANANNKEGLKNNRKKRNIERDEKLKQIFSADEYAKWESHKKEMKEKHKAKMKKEMKDPKAKKEEVEDEMQDIVED